MTAKEFTCNNKRIASYLEKRGHVLIMSDVRDGKVVYVFEYDDGIHESILEYKDIIKRCMF